MPAFRFVCESCAKTFTKLKPQRVTSSPCPTCGKDSALLLSSSTTTSIMETKDRYHGKSIRKGVKEQLAERMHNHDDKYELAEKIDKYGMDDAIKHGWVKKANRKL